MFCDKFHLLGGTCQRERPVLQTFSYTGATFGHHVLDVMTMLIDCLSASHLSIEVQGSLEIETRHAG